MGSHNSLSVEYTDLYRQILLDIAMCYSDSEPERDWNKIQKRFSQEGMAFLTKNLPRLGKAVDIAIQGELPLLPIGFKTYRGVPKLFGFLFQRVFGSDSYVRSDADVRALMHLRQLLYFAYKLELPYDEKDEQSVLSTFVAVENEIKNLVIDPRDPVIKRARSFITTVLSGLCHRDIIPRHGPGSVSTGERGAEKSAFSRIYGKLEVEYPFTEYFFLNANHVADRVRGMSTLEVLDAGTAKVVLVPKDSRGPRLISCEPLENQWIQQGQMSKLVGRLESHPLTRGHVNFTDQTVNREMALSSSVSTEYVTLDMKDASDRVSVALVEQLFCGSSWLAALMASRSSSTRLPSGQVIELYKFAPMGSAVCFPVEALCFYALAVSALQVHRQRSRMVAAASVYVYGDDIICRREDYPTIMEQLERFGLLFNRSKCCVSGLFRESCGCDAYNGVDITPVRLRKTWCRSRTDAASLVSYVELSNNLHARGYILAAEYVKQSVERLYGRLPIVSYTMGESQGGDLISRIEESARTQQCSRVQMNLEPTHGSKDRYAGFLSRSGQVIGFFRPEVTPRPYNARANVRYRFNAKLQRLEMYGYTIAPVYTDQGEGEWEHYFRTFLSKSRGVQRGRYTVARRSRLKRGWAPIF